MWKRLLFASVLTGAVSAPLHGQSTAPAASPSAAASLPPLTCTPETDPSAPLTVKAADPCSIVYSVQRAGYRATILRDTVGDPKIQSAAAGSRFSILFYGCTDHKKCQSIEFTVGYITKTKPTVEKINEWNRSKRFGKAYIDDEKDPHIDYDIVLGDEGFPHETFSAGLERWTTVMAEFQSFVGW